MRDMKRKIIFMVFLLSDKLFISEYCWVIESIEIFKYIIWFVLRILFELENVWRKIIIIVGWLVCDISRVENGDWLSY